MACRRKSGDAVSVPFRRMVKGIDGYAARRIVGKQTTEMNIALGSDMQAEVVEAVATWLQRQGHKVVPFGAVGGGGPVSWSVVAVQAASAVAVGQCDQAVLFCWTGTGVSLAANKVRGIRAALCGDAATAAGAREWNDANVLAMSIRTTTPALAEEMMEAWFRQAPSEASSDVAALDWLSAWEQGVERPAAGPAEPVRQPPPDNWAII